VFIAFRANGGRREIEGDTKTVMTQCPVVQLEAPTENELQVISSPARWQLLFNYPEHGALRLHASGRRRTDSQKTGAEQDRNLRSHHLSISMF
jgi:hypothetical protein